MVKFLVNDDYSNFSFERDPIDGFVITPHRMQGEAGRFMERRLLDKEVHLFIKTPNYLEWNENVEITG